MLRLRGYTQTVGYALRNSPALPQPGDGYMLAAIDLGVGMWVFEFRLVAIVVAI